MKESATSILSLYTSLSINLIQVLNRPALKSSLKFAIPANFLS